MKDNDAKVSKVNKVIGMRRVYVVVPLRLGVLNGLRIDFTMTKVQAKMARKYEMKIDMGLRFSIFGRFVFTRVCRGCDQTSRGLRVVKLDQQTPGILFFSGYIS